MPRESYTLLGNGRPPQPRKLSRYFCNELDPRRGNLALLFCYMITGLLDSSAVFTWGTFVSMQTGNTVFFGLGLVETDDDRWIKSGVSILSFCLGSLCFVSFHRIFSSPRLRGVLCASFMAQLACIITAAIIVTVNRPVREEPLSWHVLVPLVFVAFQSSGQAVTSRVLKEPGLTSVVLTSVYCDLFSHHDLLSPTVIGNAEEVRRVGAVICLLFGTVLGGLWAHSSVGLMGALWTAALLKAAVVLAWLVWKADEGHWVKHGHFNQ